MLRATAAGPGGSLAILGLSFENLRRMRGGESIQFAASEVALGDGNVDNRAVPIAVEVAAEGEIEPVELVKQR